MQFLHPAFLFALLATAIPIVLHFLHRRRLDRIPFAPMRFLVTTQQRQSRRLHLRRLLLLVLRVAAIVSIVLALARPTLTGGLNWLAPEGTAVSVLLLVDDSASMRTQSGEGILFDEAKREAARIAGTLSGKDELCIATFSDHLQPLLEDFVSAPGLVLAALEDRRCGFGGTDYITALSAALDLMARASNPRREIHLIGDLQESAVDSFSAAVLARRIQGDPDLHLFLRRVEAEPFANRQIADLRLPATLLQPGETAELGVSVRQDGDRPLTTPLFLEIDGVKVGETELHLPPRGGVEHTFPVTLPEAAELTGAVRLRPDRYSPDDQFWFVMEIPGRVPVLVLKGLPQSEPRRDPVLFLQAALDPTGRGSGGFSLTVEDASRVSGEDLQGSRVVVGVDPYELGAARVAALGDYLREGGAVLLFLGDPRERAYANEKLLPQWTSVRLGPFRGGTGGFEHLEVAATDHPAFGGFAPEEIATLQEARLRDFYVLATEEGRTLLRYRGGGVAVTERKVGKGRLVVCGFHPSAAAGDLPFSPMFLPLVQRLVAYLVTAAVGATSRTVEVGQPLSVPAPKTLGPTQDLWLKGPRGETLPVEVDGSSLPPRLRTAASRGPGVFTFLVAGTPWAHVAVNVPAAESRRRFLDPSELERALLGGESLSVRELEGEDVEKALATVRRGRPLHRGFLLLGGLLLVAEGLLGRRISSRERA